ncbi:unnamed protein product [Cuscuta epithymum]|uniref:RNase H type-1 domain-containing protein n=1 Tax=Cuscuta epithymum TaxID=186058 RepID=A0AAV0D3P5_9ASTE|nr:unnamed protein product [Cuscuta epithymum]
MANTAWKSKEQSSRPPVRGAVEEGFVGFQVETDSAMVMGMFNDGEVRRWSDIIQETTLFVERNGLRLGHVLRKGNWSAHFLASDHSGLFKRYSSPNSLPIRARRAFFMDKFSIPSIRF